MDTSNKYKRIVVCMTMKSFIDSTTDGFMYSAQYHDLLDIFKNNNTYIPYIDIDGKEKKDTLLHMMTDKDTYNYLVCGFIDGTFDMNENILVIKTIDVNLNYKKYDDMVIEIIKLALEMTFKKEKVKVILEDLSHNFDKCESIYLKLGFKYENDEHVRMIGYSDEIMKSKDMLQMKSTLKKN